MHAVDTLTPRLVVTGSLCESTLNTTLLLFFFFFLSDAQKNKNKKTLPYVTVLKK